MATRHSKPFSGGVVRDVRLLNGRHVHDIRKEPTGTFAGPIGPDAPVGTFAGVPRVRRQGNGTFAGNADRQRQGSFADVEIRERAPSDARPPHEEPARAA